MPPATACVQERSDIREVPRFHPQEPEFDPEATPGELADEKEQRRLMKEYLQFHGFEVGEGSQ